jgi:hypothetical protein
MHPENVIEFGCGHSNSCQNCAKKWLTSLIQKGSVQKLHCPEAGCKVEASQTLIKSLVERDVFEKFENLILNDALRNVPEVVRTCWTFFKNVFKNRFFILGVLSKNPVWTRNCGRAKSWLLSLV